MKKITYVSFSATPSTNPSSLQIVKTCEALSKLGYDTELIIPNTGINNKIDFFYNIKNKFKIRKIKFVKSFPVGLSFYIYSLVSFLIILFKSNNVTITRSFFVSFLLKYGVLTFDYSENKKQKIVCSMSFGLYIDVLSVSMRFSVISCIFEHI